MQQRVLTLAILATLAGCQTLKAPVAVSPAVPAVTETTVSASPVIDEVTTVATLDANTAAPEMAVETVPTAEEMVDLWIRIRGGMTFDVPENDQVIAQREWYERNQEYMDRMAGRAAMYLHHIVETLERRQMPMELALLPVVESAFQPYAYSRARASGLWQFIPGTGKRYGLQQNWWQDERRDVVQSTEAALDYLDKLHKQFDGDWLLAVAGYNCGEGNVSRAIRKNKAKGLPTDFWSLKLPKETRAYVPKLLALVQLLGQPERFALQWKNIPNTPYFTRVKVDSQIDIALAAELAGISVEEIYQLNPSYTRWATDPNGEHELLLPIASAERFTNELEKVPLDERVKWSHYQVKKGDTLGKIAKDFRTSVEQLKTTNKLKGNNLRLGQDLLIPKSISAAGQPAPVVAFLSSREKNEILRGAIAVKGIHEVRNGDTLWSISRKYGVKMSELLTANNLTSRSTLRAKQKIKLPGASDSRSEKRSDTSAAGRIRYTVRSGDSLLRIAQKFSVDLDDIKRWNNLSGNDLRSGKKLTLYIRDANGG